MARPGTFKPGQSGNPNGRPSEARATLNSLLEQCFTPAKRVKVLNKLIADAIDGQHDARTLLLAYTFGKPTEHKEITGADGAPLMLPTFNWYAVIAEIETGSDDYLEAPVENENIIDGETVG